MLIRKILVLLLVVLTIPFLRPPHAPSTANAQEAGCSVDLMMVLDGSGSIQPDDFSLMKLFAADLVNAFEISPDDANIGIIQFANTAELYLPISNDEENILTAIDNMTQFGERTNIAEALDLAQSQFAPRREGTPRVILVLTDGLHNIPTTNPIARADIARAQGTYILGIAVGDVDLSELISISGGPENVITVGSFEGLSVILDILLNNTCTLAALPNNLPVAGTTDTPDTTQATATPADASSPASTPAPTRTPTGPRQTQIAFASDRDGDSEIYVMNGDGSNVRQITFNTVDDDKPSWSKDGRKLAFESNLDGDYDVYMVDADGSNLINISDNNLDDWGPSWSPDGSQIAFHSNQAGSIEIFVMNADGSNQRRLTTNTVATDRSPSWSPDGSQIIYFSDVSGGREIYIIDVSSGDIRRLSDNSYYDGQPDWSLNGTQVVFASTRSATNPDIFIMRVDGTNVTRITDDPATDDDPVWSPDGRQIVFESTRGGSFDIWIMNADGTGLTQLTDDPARDWSADWIWLPE